MTKEKLNSLKSMHAVMSAGGKRKDYRTDGYQNMLNKYGTYRDSTEHYHYVEEDYAMSPELTKQYEGNGLFAKIIDTPAEEAMKHGFNLNVLDEGINDAIMEKLDLLDYEEKFATAIKWARLFGGSVIVMLIDDGRNLDEPVDWVRAKNIDELLVFERAIVQPDYTSLYQTYGDYNGLPGDHSKFGKPQWYYISSITGFFKVHESRVLVFHNSTMPEVGVNIEYHFWGVPEYVRIKRVLKETITAHGDAVKLLERSVQAIYKMRNLAQLLATDEGENQALKRLEVIDMARGILNSIAIDADGEDYSFQQFSVQGISEVIDSTCNMLSAITQIPQTVLFGRSPAGMNSTGQSDLENYYNFIEHIQKTMVKANLHHLIQIIMFVEARMGRIDNMAEFKLEFNPLWSMTESEQANVDQTKAQIAQTKAYTAQVYVDMGALDPSEVREGLKSSEEYQIEDLIDEEAPDILTKAERDALNQYKMQALTQEQGGGEQDPMAAMMAGAGGAPEGQGNPLEAMMGGGNPEEAQPDIPKRQDKAKRNIIKRIFSR
ncbi:MAG: DUF1073 domain-containing protein [Clostridia bacterium]|nr:DUF1073 domain-containing protein [Clostridia bacterium]